MLVLDCEIQSLMGGVFLNSPRKNIIDNCPFKNWELLSNIEKLNENSRKYPIKAAIELGVGSAIKDSRFININLADIKSKSLESLR